MEENQEEVVSYKPRRREWQEEKRGHYFQDIKQSDWQAFLETKSG